MARHAPTADAELNTESTSEPELQSEADEPLTKGGATSRRARCRLNTPVNQAAALGIVSVVALTGIVGWQGYRTYHTYEAAEWRELFVQAGRRVAVDLTTIDYKHVDSDVTRILDSTTGQFHDDFQRRSGPFADVVKKAQTTSTGTVAGAGVELVDDDQAQVLVALQVKTSNVGGEQSPHGWRMRITVQKVGDDVKVSDVQLVP